MNFSPQFTQEVGNTLSQVDMSETTGHGEVISQGFTGMIISEGLPDRKKYVSTKEKHVALKKYTPIVPRSQLKGTRLYHG